MKAADLVTLARSAVERDYRGEIEFAHAPEAPTRFAKQLVQLLRGAISIGMTPAEAMRLVRRCGADSIPPLRRDVLLDLAENPGSRVGDVRKRIAQPRNTVRRGLECLHMLGTLACEERKPAAMARNAPCGATGWRTASIARHCAAWSIRSRSGNVRSYRNDRQTPARK